MGRAVLRNIFLSARGDSKEVIGVSRAGTHFSRFFTWSVTSVSVILVWKWWRTVKTCCGTRFNKVMLKDYQTVCLIYFKLFSIYSFILLFQSLKAGHGYQESTSHGRRPGNSDATATIPSSDWRENHCQAYLRGSALPGRLRPAIFFGYTGHGSGLIREIDHSASAVAVSTRTGSVTSRAGYARPNLEDLLFQIDHQKGQEQFNKKNGTCLNLTSTQNQWIVKDVISISLGISEQIKYVIFSNNIIVFILIWKI